jgi:hypothetical protein
VGGDGLGRGIGDPLRDHLVIVDRLAAGGLLLRCSDGLGQQLRAGGEDQAGIVEGGSHLLRISWG